MPSPYQPYLNSITSSFSKCGDLPPTNYDVPLTNAGVMPTGMEYISLISSIAGGLLLYSFGGVIYQLQMPQNSVYNVAWPIDKVQILSGPVTDWQGNADLENTVTDLTFAGN